MQSKENFVELPSKTYKLVVPETVSRHSIYFTVVLGEKGKACWLFVNSKEMKAFQWVSALMTSYSRQLASGGKLVDIIADMKETFDPNGAYHIPDGSGRQVNSIVHHLGLVLEEKVL